MKKLTSITLAFAIFSSTLVFSIEKPLLAKAEENAIQSFITKTVELIKENDADKDFVAENEEEIETASYALSVDEPEDTTFQTCRLIVKSDNTPDKLNSVGIASGFQNYHIVQFATSEDAEKAYNVYLADKNIISVTIDKVFKVTCDVTVTEETINDESRPPKRLDSWGGDVTGLYSVKDYIEDNYSNLDEVIVGVIDSGIYLEHEFFKDRIERTYFNSASDGERKNESDTSDGVGHGTNVSGVIVDCTPDNVKIANYKFINAEGLGTASEVSLAFLQAINDRVDVINASVGVPDESGLFASALQEAHKADIPVIAAAGNETNYIGTWFYELPATDEEAISVASISQDWLPSWFSSYGHSVDLVAPGENIRTVQGNSDGYCLESGTSLSAPMVASLTAILISLNPGISRKELEIKMESTAVPTDLIKESDLFGYGNIDAIAACGFVRAKAPEINCESGKYTGEITLELSVDDDCEIYYTVDGSYPTPKNGMLYEEKIALSNDILYFKAVTYSDNIFKSVCTKRFYRLQTLGTDEMFTISDDGEITSYTGENIYDLIIPESVNGITVTDISANVFSESEIYGVTMPKSLNYVPASAFSDNELLMFADGDLIETICTNAFSRCKNLCSISFPNVLSIGLNAFVSCYSLAEAYFPECVSAEQNSFGSCNSLRNAYFPKLKYIGRGCFGGCAMLSEIYIPNLVDMEASLRESKEFSSSEIYKGLELVNVESVPIKTFNESSIVPIIEFSKVREIKSLPTGTLLYQKVKFVLPSTLEEITETALTNTTPSSYMVYGTKGTYAEQWANEKGFEFVEITPETAIINDLPDECYSYMRPLEADVVGFNKTYQWYGANTPRYAKGIAIDNATERKFNPNEHQQYKYYYCVVTSTDGDYEPIKIKTGICENKSYVYTYTPPTSNGSVTIATPSNRYLKYGESINLYANATGLPEGAKIKWRIVEGSGVTLDPSVSGKICTVTSKSNGDVIIEAYAVNKNGNTLVNDKGNRICDKEGISSEVSLWWIILYYIKMIFSISTTAINILK